jgi:hypothetical protein
MSEILEEDIQAKSEYNSSIRLKKSSDSSNDSQNNDDEKFFWSSSLLLKSNLINSEHQQNKPNQKEKIFDSMDLVIKKKLFSSEVGPKTNPKRSSEAVSTEPTSIRVKNYNSPKKRYSIFRLIEKSKSKKDINRLFVKKEEEKEIHLDKKERRDIYGNIICKKNKKNVKVSFVDVVTLQPLANITDIESFKNYNCVYGLPKEEKLEKKSNCQCCLIC